MEKRNIKVDFWGSGINTLKGFGVTFYIIGALLPIVGIIGLATSYDGDFIIILPLLLISMIICLAFGAICFGLSGMAKTALYKKAIMEDDYEFIQGSDNALTLD